LALAPLSRPSIFQSRKMFRSSALPES
jgi:hypothetical protein